MKCAACQSKMIKKDGEIDLRIKGKLFIVRNVAHEECSSCGERVLSPEISSILFERIKNEEFVEQMIRVPVLDGVYA